MRVAALLMVVVFAGLQVLAGGMVAQAAGQTGTSSVLSALVTGNNEFAGDMYGNVALANKDKNIFFSPLSISMALGMTYAGACGDTERQMADVLHFGLPQESLHTTFSLLAGQLKSRNVKGCKLNIANALWGQKDYSFRADFIRIVGKNYGGGFNTANFAADPEGSRQKINRWVENNTAGKIKDLLQRGDINSLTRLVLTNAVYFKGDWVEKFDPQNTAKSPFYAESGAVAVDMMHQTGSFGYAATDQWQVLEMPYAGDKLTMVVLLPRKEAQAPDLDSIPAGLNKWLDGLEVQDVDVSLPKFKLAARYSLGNTLSELGMADAFSLPPADFSGMTGKKNLYITAVIHQAVIEVNEQGSEAAAATAVIMGTKCILSSNPEFRADHPFIFLIRDKSTGSILFLGRVANPVAE